MSSLFSRQTELSTAAQTGLPPFMATQPVRGKGADDGFSRTLQNRLDTPAERNRERAPERSNEAAPTRERSAAEQGRTREAQRPAEASRRSERAGAQDTNAPPAERDTAEAAGEATEASGPATPGQEQAQAAETTGNAAEQRPATAALPAAIAALMQQTAGTTASSDAAETDPAMDVLSGGKTSGLAPLVDDSKGKSLQNSRADKLLRTVDAGVGNNATKIASLVAQLQSRGTPSATAFTESPAKAMQTLQGEAPQGLQSIFSPRAPNPLQPGPQLTVATPLGQRGWSEDVGNKLIWMTNRGESKAELVITPPNLGKVEVSINMNGDQATAHFVASTREAKEALEHALPRLRELMEQSGVNLGQTSVSTSGGQQAHGEESTRNGGRGRGEDGAGDEIVAAPANGPGVWTRQSEGLVDTFA